MRRRLSLLVLLLSIPGLWLGTGCALEPAPTDPVSIVGPSDKADGVEQRPELFYVSNELASPVNVILGGAGVYAIWTTGTSAQGVRVEAQSTSDLAVYGEDIGQIAVVDDRGSPLDPDSLRGSIERDAEGRIVLALVVGEPIASQLEPLEDYVPLDAEEIGRLDGLAPEDIGESYTGDGVGYSDSKATAYGWATDSGKRDRMKSEARGSAWRRHRRSPEFAERLQACRAAGGRDLFTSGEDCSYMPIDPFVWFETECRASCTFTYRCMR